ncbi:ATP phosphoribosyltransferase [Halocella sp. SP3-1]|uniref:ATP phosphoribosyltransferase n=1 Tax=Halocella sp. SP3-1 TaxID=2382161 RepID=UPI000F7652F5|nr:ATP phosphoribosyltransferase [Halocella sp. SP3-1]AZO96279.1 ATP phosphoribosyltransferase [Halocella sp. SP3-1]
MAKIITALPKGRLMKQVVEILKEAGFISTGLDIDEISRKLVFTDEKTGHSFLLAKPKDVPVYVEHGAADIGVTGKDVILEHGKRLYEVQDLKVGACKLVVAVPAEQGINRVEDIPDHSRVATSFPNITRHFFQKIGKQVEIIYLNGSVELAPLVDLADLIVDITSTGTTLRKNNLLPIADIAFSSSRLIVNNVSYKTKHGIIGKLIEKLNEVKGDDSDA